MKPFTVGNQNPFKGYQMILLLAKFECEREIEDCIKFNLDEKHIEFWKKQIDEINELMQEG